MIKENRTSKYLLYAIGEILLVVIGILIALQLNNWNNGQKDKQAEIKYLNQINNSLKNSQLILNARIDRNKTILKEGEVLFDHLKSKKPLNDSIKQFFVIPVFDHSVSLSTAAFENLKSDGLSLISNDNLKIDIINIYDQELNFIQTRFANQVQTFINSVVEPFYAKNFEWDSKENQVVPNNYVELLQKREMTNILSEVNALRNYAIRIYEDTQKKLSDLTLKIGTEIKTLEE